MSRFTYAVAACAAFALSAIFSAASLAAGFEDKEVAIQQASTKALEQLISHRDAGTLDDDSAMAIIQREISPQFDFNYLTMFVLGKHWRKASDDEKADLTSLFQNLVERTYSKSLAKFKEQEIRFLPSEVFKDGSVSVGVNVLNKGQNVLIDYLLKENDGQWVVSDVKIENVSLLGNFRRQFNTIIRKDGIAGLIGLLRSKA